MKKKQPEPNPEDEPAEIEGFLLISEEQRLKWIDTHQKLFLMSVQTTVPKEKWN